MSTSLETAKIELHLSCFLCPSQNTTMSKAASNHSTNSHEKISDIAWNVLTFLSKYKEGDYYILDEGYVNLINRLKDSVKLIKKEGSEITLKEGFSIRSKYLGWLGATMPHALSLFNLLIPSTAIAMVATQALNILSSLLVYEQSSSRSKRKAKSNINIEAVTQEASKVFKNLAKVLLLNHEHKHLGMFRERKRNTKKLARNILKQMESIIAVCEKSLPGKGAELTAPLVEVCRHVYRNVPIKSRSLLKYHEQLVESAQSEERTIKNEEKISDLERALEEERSLRKAFEERMTKVEELQSKLTNDGALARVDEDPLEAAEEGRATVYDSDASIGYSYNAYYPSSPSARASSEGEE